MVQSRVPQTFRFCRPAEGVDRGWFHVNGQQACTAPFAREACTHAHCSRKWSVCACACSLLTQVGMFVHVLARCSRKWGCLCDVHTHLPFPQPDCKQLTAHQWGTGSPEVGNPLVQRVKLVGARDKCSTMDPGNQIKTYSHRVKDISLDNTRCEKDLGVVIRREYEVANAVGSSVLVCVHQIHLQIQYPHLSTLFRKDLEKPGRSSKKGNTNDQGTRRERNWECFIFKRLRGNIKYLKGDYLEES